MFSIFIFIKFMRYFGMNVLVKDSDIQVLIKGKPKWVGYE